MVGTSPDAIASAAFAHPTIYRGAIQSLIPYATMATAPTPPSQSATNHSNRRASGAGFFSGGVNGSRSRD
ncbi:MAG: hypothetical protein QOJ86_5172 [Bradyrhizobium sp.]|nr:hypothetical protein [Bradyrhizobium sp.]